MIAAWFGAIATFLGALATVAAVLVALFAALAALLGALATLAAVLVALFKDEFWRWWREPELAIRSEPKPPDWHMGKTVDGYECYYLRLWIRNTGGSPATHVEVFASRLLQQKEGSDEFDEERSFLPMNLKWAHSQELFRERINPKMGRHCDLGHISDPSFKPVHKESLPNVCDRQTLLCLAVEAPPITRVHLLRPGTYRLELTIAADNAAPKKIWVKIVHGGGWFDTEEEMFKESNLSLNIGA